MKWLAQLWLAFLLVLLPVTSFAQLWDQNFTTNRGRSAIGNVTSFSWTASCPWSTTLCPAPAGSVSGGDCADCDNSGFSASNYYAKNYAGESTYWVISHNIDGILPGYGALTAFTNACLTGPPDQSAALSSGTTAVFTFNSSATGPGGALAWRLGAQSDKMPDCNGDSLHNASDGIPYISIGDDVRAGHGSSTPIGTFYSSAAGQWSNTGVDGYYKMYGSLTEAAPGYFYLLAISEWGGKPRGLFIYLGVRGTIELSDFGGSFRWNFPDAASMWQKLPSTGANIGGADYAFISADKLIAGGHIGGCTWGSTTGCFPANGTFYNIQVNLAGAFEVANSLGLWETSMPGSSTQKSIYGVHWAVETNQNTLTYAYVSKMNTYTLP